MLLYTIADPAIVLAGLDFAAIDPEVGPTALPAAPGPAASATAGGSAARPLEVASDQGYVAQVEYVHGPWARVVRVISSDPQVYLRPELQPGRVICAHCLGLKPP